MPHLHLNKLSRPPSTLEFLQPKVISSTEFLPLTNQPNSRQESPFLLNLSVFLQTSIWVFLSMSDQETKLHKTVESIYCWRTLTWRLLLTPTKLSTTALLKCQVVNSKWTSTDNRLSTEPIASLMMSSMSSQWWLTVLLNLKTLSHRVLVSIKIKKAIS